MHLLYACQSTMQHVPVGANASLPLEGQRKGFLCIHSTHLPLSRLWCRTLSEPAGRRRHPPTVPPLL